jgi:hypothetical protein
MNGFGQGFDVEAALKLAKEMEKPKRSVTRPPVASPFEIDKAALAAAVAGTKWAPPASPYAIDEAAIEAALAGTKWGDPVPPPATPPPPAALTNDQWMDQMVDQGRFVGDLTDVNEFTTATTPAEMTQAEFDAGGMVADPRIGMREQAAADFLEGGGTQQQLDDFLKVVGGEDWFNMLANDPQAMQEFGPEILAAQQRLDDTGSATLPWMDSPEFQKQYTPPTIVAEDDGTIVCPVGQHAENGVCVPDQVVQQTDFGGPGEKPAAMTPVGNFVDSQTEALAVIQRRLDEITNATNAARDSGIEQIDIIQSEAQKQLDATFANQYTVLDPMTGEPLKEGEMDRLLATWKDEQSKSKTARAADKAVIGNLALAEGIVSSQMEFDTIDTLYGDQIDAQYQYIDSLYRIGKLAKDDRDAMLTNIMAGYKSDLTNKAIEIILGAEIDTADRRAEVREDALAARDVAEYLGAPANTIFGGMRGDIPIGEMAYQTGERIAGEEFAAGESALDRLAQGINPATGRPYGFMTSGPYAGMTIGEANAARQEKDLIDLQMGIMEAEEARAVDAVDLEAERYEEMWREGGKGWYDLGLNPATGRPWNMDDDDDSDVYGEPIPSGFYAADFDNMKLPNVEVIDGQYWMTPTQFAQIGPVLEAKAAKDADPFGDMGDPAGSIEVAAMRVAGTHYADWEKEVNRRIGLSEKAGIKPGDTGWLPQGTSKSEVFEKLIAETAYINPYAGAVWANFTGQPVMGAIKGFSDNGEPYTDPDTGQVVPIGTAFTANPDGTFEIGYYGPEIVQPTPGFYPPKQ